MSEFVEVARLSDLAAGTMRAVAVGDADVLLANVDGRIHAISNRCGHMNAPLAEGVITGAVVQCPFHGARFDVTTGQKVGDAVIAKPPGIEKAPPEMMPFLAKAGQMTAKIATKHCVRYEVVIEGDIVKVRV